MNRNERVYDRPDAFDLYRTPNRHVTFGAGAHTCLGARLARLELTALFAEMLGKWDSVEVAGVPRRLEARSPDGICALPISVRV